MVYLLIIVAILVVLSIPAAIQGYGKGAIVGAAGELEHGALWHVPGGYAMRQLIPASMAIVPSTIIVDRPSTIDERGSPLKSRDTSGSSV